MNTIPFKIDNVFGGLGECHGLLRHEGKFLVLEFQLQDSVVNLLKSGIKGVEIALADVAYIELRRRWFGLSNTLIVQLSRMELTEQIPGTKQGRLVLGIARADVPAAKNLIAGVQQTPVS